MQESTKRTLYNWFSYGVLITSGWIACCAPARCQSTSAFVSAAVPTGPTKSDNALHPVDFAGLAAEAAAHALDGYTTAVGVTTVGAREAVLPAALVSSPGRIAITEAVLTGMQAGAYWALIRTNHRKLAQYTNLGLTLATGLVAAHNQLVINRVLAERSTLVRY